MPRKRVAQGVLDNVPEIGENHRIVKMILPKGGHLFEVLLANGEKTICRMPPKFRNLVWVKRGDFLVIEINASTTKVAGDIMQILYPDQIKFLKQQSKWPVEFDSMASQEEPKEGKAGEKEEGEGDDDDQNSNDEDDEIFVNTNRRVVEEDYSSDEYED